MHAIIKAGSRQHKLKKGDIVDLDLPRDLEEGAQLDLGPVLFLQDGEEVCVGAPEVENAKVSAEVLQVVKCDKVIAYRFKRRQNYHRKQGHRQQQVRVRITEISKG